MPEAIQDAKQLINSMKGQSIPLLNYHLMRDHVLPTITAEFQSSILYWAGRNLATSFIITSYDQLSDFFLEVGWGKLEIIQSKPHIKKLKLSSNHFGLRSVTDNPSTFALECGFIAAAASQIEGKESEGEFELGPKDDALAVTFIIYLLS
jgi:hypothetical protein